MLIIVDQEALANLSPFDDSRNQLEELMDMDDHFERRILTVHIFHRDGNESDQDVKRPRIARLPFASEEIGHFIESESKMDAGSTAISSRSR
jgi:hypothetical protein